MVQLSEQSSLKLTHTCCCHGCVGETLDAAVLVVAAFLVFGFLQYRPHRLLLEQTAHFTLQA